MKKQCYENRVWKSKSWNGSKLEKLKNTNIKRVFQESLKQSGLLEEEEGKKKQKIRDKMLNIEKRINVDVVNA